MLIVRDYDWISLPINVKVCDKDWISLWICKNTANLRASLIFSYNEYNQEHRLQIKIAKYIWKWPVNNRVSIDT